MLLRSLLSAGAPTPLYTGVRSSPDMLRFMEELWGMLAVDGGVPDAMIPGASGVCERMDRGSDSRDPPQAEFGAIALIEALLSSELRRGARCEDDARVRTEALSLRRLLAVALRYVVGTCMVGLRWGGTAEAGFVGNWWSK